MAADAKETTGVKVPFRFSVSLLRTYLKPHWFKMSLLALLPFVSIGFEILNPQLLGHFIDSIQSSMKVLLSLALLFMNLVIANQFVTALASFLEERFSSIEDIQSLGAQAYVMLRLSQLARRMVRITRLSSVKGKGECAPSNVNAGREYTNWHVNSMKEKRG